MKNLKIILLLVLSFLTLPQISLAAPAINSASGSFSHGQNMTISGSGFGTKSPAAPISWDDFENQILGQSVANSTPIVGTNWTLQRGAPGTDSVVFDSARAISGTKSVRIDWLNESINAFGWSNQGPFNQLYISYWRYQTGIYTQGINNHKQFYVFGTYGPNELPQLLNLIPASDSRWGIGNNQACNGGTYALETTANLTDLTYNATKDRWDRWELYLELNDLNVFNGIITEWVNGIQKLNRTNFKHRCDGVDGQWSDFRLGNMFQGPGAGAPEALKEAWFDDIYVDITQSRVEICSGDTWQGRGYCQIQLPVAWSENSITATINQGSFNIGDTKYLYVIGQDGSANATGYPVMLVSSGGDTTSPAAPTGVVIQ